VRFAFLSYLRISAIESTASRKAATTAIDVMLLAENVSPSIIYNIIVSN